MSFSFFEELGKSIEKTIQKQMDKTSELSIISKVEGVKNEEVELAKKLDAIEEYSIDRFEENQVVLEDRKTGKMKNVDKNKLPSECKEGDILKCINGKYIIDKEGTKRVEKEIEEKYKDLWE